MNIDLAKNKPETLPFVIAVGKLIHNSGFIELQSHLWISALQADPELFEKTKRLPLRKRIQILRALIQCTELIPEESKEEMDKLWAAFIPHAEMRNIVAHSAVVFANSKKNPEPAGTVIGVMNVRPRDKSKEAELVSVEEIEGAANAVGKIGEDLYKHFGELKKADGSNSP